MRKIIKNIARNIATKLVPEISYPVLRGPLKGMKIIHGALGGPSKGASIYFNLFEIKQTTEFFNRINSGDIVFDIGANIGYYSMLSSRKIGENGKIFSFEPVIRNLSFLYRHVEQNKLKNITILPLACSENSELVKFSFGLDTAQGHLLEVENPVKTVNSYDRITYIHTISIDEFISRSGNYPNIVKIDVEGSELLVLKGAVETLTNIKPVIFLSIHSNDLEISCKEYLLKFGYKFILLDEKERPSVEYICL